jgi:hypothetical protein
MRNQRFVSMLCATGLLVAGSFAADAQQGPALPLGKPAAGTASGDAPAVYQFNATTAGVLTVVVQGSGDLYLAIKDADGQTLPDGTADRDLMGSTGTEQLTVTLTEAGQYRVHVQQQDSSPAKFQIAASWLSFPGFALAPDPDKRPTTARAVPVGTNHEDSLDSDTGDRWDWFVFTPATAGTFTVILRPVADSDIDLQLEVFLGTDFEDSVARSDQDLQGNSANESATIDVQAGQKVHVKVSGAHSRVTGKYRISSSLIQ